MPDLLEHMYCAQQINIPPNLPYILKQYAKAAIRTQPYDLLYWSAAYFRAKAKNLPPPVKERLEYPPFDSPSRLSPGFLRVLHKQLGAHEYVRVEVLYEKWLGVCLVKEALASMLKIGDIHHRVPWLKFVAIASGHICTTLSKTMVLVCEILTDQPDGGAAWIPVEKFVELYQFLALLNCGPERTPTKTVELNIQTPSLTSTKASTVVTDGNEESESKEGDKDSTTGLMVWQDIKPHSKFDRPQTPKAEDEPGASSEYGVEVFNSAKGPDTEVVTLYPATTKSEVSGKQGVPVLSSPSSKIGAKFCETDDDERVLSHTSLKENENWVKIEAKDLDEERKGSDQPLDLEKLTAATESPKKEILAKTASQLEDSSDKVGAELIEEDNNQVKDSEDQDETEDKKDEPQNEVDTSEKKEALEEATEEIQSQESGSKENVSEEKSSSPEKSESGSISEEKKEKDTLESEESEYALDHSITMTNFVRKKEMGHSIVEIRKGKIGDNAQDEIDDANGPLASDTVHRLSVVSDESDESQEKEPKGYWDQIPGIGPVIPEAQIMAVVEYMQYWASKQGGMVGPRNITHLLCPPLDLVPPIEEEELGY